MFFSDESETLTLQEMSHALCWLMNYLERFSCMNSIETLQAAHQLNAVRQIGIINSLFTIARQNNRFEKKKNQSDDRFLFIPEDPQRERSHANKRPFHTKRCLFVMKLKNEKFTINKTQLPSAKDMFDVITELCLNGRFVSTSRVKSNSAYF